MKFFIVLAACILAAYADDEILRNDQNINEDGSYSWAYETSNGISASESGSLKDPETISAQGSFSYTSPEGEKVDISYLADDGGFQPSGSHIPVAPPIPEAIVRALAWAEAHPYVEDKH